MDEKRLNNVKLQKAGMIMGIKDYLLTEAAGESILNILFTGQAILRSFLMFS